MNSVVRETPARRSLPLPDGAISYLEWGAGEPGKAPLHFAHANGFNGLTYRRILSGLSDQFHVRAWDARGHGETTLTADPARHRNWYVYRDDLIAMAEDFKQATGKKIILAGHSMGGTASVMAAAARPDLVRGIALFDPVMIPTAARIVMLASQLLRRRGNPLADGAEKRRAVFADRQTMVDRYEGRGAFRTWPRGFLEDYVEGGTKPREDGQIELPARPHGRPRTSARRDTTSRRPSGTCMCPSRLFAPNAARPAARPFPMLLKRRDPAAHMMQVPGSTHFLPMEFPEIVAKEIRGFAARLEREGR